MKKWVILMVTLFGFITTPSDVFSLSPQTLKFKIYQLAVSTSPLCTNAESVFKVAAPNYTDVINEGTFGQGTIKTGTYMCVMFQMSDRILYSTDESEGSCVVGEESGMDINMEKLMKIHNQKTPDSKKIMEINADHPMIIKISENMNTFDHPYYRADGKLASYSPKLTKLKYGLDTEQMSLGDTYYFLNEDGQLTETQLLGIQEKIGDRQTYTLMIEDTHNFFANGLLVDDERITNE